MSQQMQLARALADEYRDRLSDWAALTCRPLFGGIGIWRGAHVFAIAWQGELYFKVDDASRPDYEAAGSQPLHYVSRGKEQALKSFWAIPAHIADDDERLILWAERAWQAAIAGV
ncbi:MAG: TfoX/Sxy family protein [Paracoccus sp. (in: a-proteobacteria)]|uniref:TfoX/Sxy family protein n=1 Tax=Paracoccus sp. TaxID=267 RepID=UPI0026DFFCF5|nr:TfoX/Sxy family protein [Paracoccus sp. (in: a-proteobacteria)]MDO5630640.1 TfoX/Sxy family protein [Paracoccus sp. (in: a-proteobacteria)]